MPFLRFSIISTVLCLLVGGYVAYDATKDADNAVEEANRRGGDAESMFRAANLEPALAKVRAEVGAGAELLQLAVYPGYVVAEASTGDEERGRSFKVEADGDVHEVPLRLTGPGELEDNVFPLAELDAATLERLAGQVVKGEEASLDDVTHILATVDPISGRPGWNVYVDGADYWQAALDGSGLEDVGERGEQAVERAGDVASCVQEAGTDAAELQACAAQ